MSDVLHQNWQTSEDAVANSVGGETVILHLGNGNYFGLDAIGSLLWEGLKLGQQPGDICTKILEEYDVDRGTLEKDLRAFLHDLAENGLIAPG